MDSAQIKKLGLVLLIGGVLMAGLGKLYTDSNVQFLIGAVAAGLGLLMTIVGFVKK